MPAPAPTPIARVSTLELFFDLVFVFTITQLTSGLVETPTWRTLARTVLTLGIVWWMYDGYAWLTNAVAPTSAGRRLLLLGGMGGYLVLALAIPGAFAGSGTAFGVAYLVIVVIHAALFTRTASQSVVRAILRLAPFNLGAAALVLAGGIAGGAAQYALWTGAFVLEWVLTSWLAGIGDFEVGPGHFVERHGLVVLIAIGESVVAIGIGAAGLPIDPGLIGVALLGLGLSACLWWAYFGGDDARAERAITRAPAPRRAALALYAFGYCHLVLLLGVIVAAAGLHHAIADATAALGTARALTLAGGVALYLLGDVCFRATLGIGRSGWRAAAAAAALATIPLGARVAAVAQLAALVAVMLIAFAGEGAGARPPAAVAETLG
jgi:low temperature requirement protein LtrA